MQHVPVNGLLEGLGRTMSYALQFGTPVNALCESLKGMAFEPSGQTNNPDIERCASLLDYLGAWLEREYCG